MEAAEIERAHHTHTGRPLLDLVLGISALVISVFSRVQGIHNGNAMERLVLANSWPYAEATFSTSNLDGTPHIHLDLANKAVGPARVESLQVLYNGTPVGGARLLLDAILHRTTSRDHPTIQTSSIVHMVMAAKEQIHYVDFPASSYSKDDYEAIAVAMSSIDTVTCYCSVFDDCWEFDSRKLRATPVRACSEPKVPFG